MRKTSPARTRIGLLGPIVSVCTTIAATIVFNFLPQYVGTARLAGGTYAFEPALTPEFGWFLPALNLWWAALLGLNFAHLLLQRWTKITRLLDLVVRIYGAGVFLALASVTETIAVPAAVSGLRATFALIGLALVIRPLLQSLPGHHTGRPVEIWPRLWH
jgi:hypothetical protein